MKTPLVALLILSTGCRDPKDTPTDTAEDVTTADIDGDGYSVDEDCDDNDGDINPGATEICDGADNDCDGEIDEDVTTTFYADADEDGFGDTSATTEACEVTEGYVSIGNDCDDADAESYPGAVERCDEADNDCDGEVDEDVQTEWYSDADSDGYGDPNGILDACDPPEGYTADATDCDDLNATAYPGAEEVCDGADNDCDKQIDEDVTTTYYQDADDDNYGVSDKTTEACTRPTGYATTSGDCNDSNSAVSPNATELCDGVDNDCDGDSDEDDAADAGTWYVDGDSDGYGGSSTTVSCVMPSGYADNSGDCNDGTAAANPGMSEVCDGIDNNCDGDTDEDESTDASTWYADNDGDGYGGTSTTVSCAMPTGFADNSTDCDDGEPLSNPGGTEVCDDIDNDCDGDTDEGVTNTFYADADGDGYGNSGFSTAACSAPTGYVSDATDCDDGESLANPGESEVCDTIDNDCDGSTDEGVTTTFYADGDGDGYGNSAYSAATCSAPTGYVTDATDCDDGEALSNPGESEVCDSIDNDCDGDTDEGLINTFYADADGDGYGNSAYSTTACSSPSGYVTDNTDCNDIDADSNPAGTEVCDGSDNNCDGDTDEGLTFTFYADKDSDGFGDAGDAVDACTLPSGHVTDSTDCDDLEEDSNPAGTEVCDGIDNNCDGETDEDSALDVSVWYADVDADGYGNADSTVMACAAPSGYTGDDTDCNDDDGAVYPDSTEVCNSVDDNCDGVVDEGLLGTTATCAAESCADILADNPSAADGSYYLDIYSDGTVDTFTCDMTTDGGGWTQVVTWDRVNEGDGWTELENELTSVYDDMGQKLEDSTYIYWSDYDGTADLLAYEREVPFANNGEIIVDIYYYGYSMESSATFVFAETTSDLENILCKEDDDGLYDSTQYTYWPYTCSESADDTWTWNGKYQDGFSDEITAFHMRSFHYDATWGDSSSLYRLNVSIR